MFLVILLFKNTFFNYVESLTIRESSLAKCSKVHMPASLARHLPSFYLKHLFVPLWVYLYTALLTEEYFIIHVKISLYVQAFMILVEIL